MVKSQAVQSSLDHLANVKNELVDRQLVLNGVFDEEIKRLESVRDEAAGKLGMVQTVEDALAARAGADEYSAKVRGAADKTMADAKLAMSAANAKMDSALTKETSVASREAQALALMEEYHAKADAYDADCAKRPAVGVLLCLDAVRGGGKEIRSCGQECVDVSVEDRIPWER